MDDKSRKQKYTSYKYERLRRSITIIDDGYLSKKNILQYIYVYTYANNNNNNNN